MRFLVAATLILISLFGCVKKKDSSDGQGGSAVDRSIVSDQQYGNAGNFAGSWYQKQPACLATDTLCYDVMSFNSQTNGHLLNKSGAKVTFGFILRAGSLTLRSDKIGTGIPSTNNDNIQSGQILMVLRLQDTTGQSLTNEKNHVFVRQTPGSQQVPQPTSSGFTPGVQVQ